jgi:DNA polymerase-3 subunit delta
VGNETPTVYLFYGDDEFSLSQEISAMAGKMGAGATAEMNITYLDGRTASLAEIRSVAATAPFLTSRRMVVLQNPLKRFRKKAEKDQFLAILENLPQATALVIEEINVLEANHWFLKWVQAQEGRAYARLYKLAEGVALARWIRDQAQESGGTFTPQAAGLLASLVGTDKRHAVQEIDKLLAFVGYRRPVEVDDVQNLATPIETEDVSQVFKMVDALGSRDGRTALNQLHSLLHQREPLSLFGMIIRQFRLILQAREIIEGGGDAETIRQQLKLHPFVAQKILAQARNFELPALESIYRHLLLLDERIKTGKVSAETALDTLIASFTQPSHSLRR